MKRIIINIEPNSFIATLEDVSPIEALGIFEYFAKKTYEKINTTTVQTNDIKSAEITDIIKAKREFLSQSIGKLDFSVRLYNTLFGYFTDVKGHFITPFQFKSITVLDILTSGFDYKKVRNAGWNTQKELVDFFAENGFEFGKPVPAEYL